MRDLAVIQYSDIEKITINEGAEPMVKGSTLEKELKKMNKRINAIRDSFLYGVTTAVEDGGATLLGCIQMNLSDLPAEENFDNITNEKIMHG